MWEVGGVKNLEPSIYRLIMRTLLADAIKREKRKEGSILKSGAYRRRDSWLFLLFCKKEKGYRNGEKNRESCEQKFRNSEWGL